MSRLDERRREVHPSKQAAGKRRAPSFGPGLNVSVPISFGLPLIVVGLALLLAATTTGRALYWVLGGLIAVGGVALFASGKRL
jgi:hypothetical protein